MHTSVLLFCVKDNPEIVMINIACSGVVPVVEILPLTKIIGNIVIIVFLMLLEDFYFPY